MTFASQHAGFVPREWQAAKGLLEEEAPLNQCREIRPRGKNGNKVITWHNTGHSKSSFLSNTQVVVIFRIFVNGNVFSAKT